jgi:hypothetical protein
MPAYSFGRRGVGEAVEEYECWHSFILDRRRDVKIGYRAYG